MKFLLVLLASVAAKANQTVFYDTYYGTPLSNDALLQRIQTNTTFWCTEEIAPCNPKEGRRVDGSCNNPAHPVRGCQHTPFLKELPSDFGEGFEPKLDQSGQPLPLPRHLRTTLLATGTRPDLIFTQLSTHGLIFMAIDIVSFQDSFNYVVWKPYCCQPRGKTDRDCLPQQVPNDDPVHRFSNVRCLNMTRPFSFQSVGCIRNDTAPEKITSATPNFDLSTVYGNTLKANQERGRLFLRGLLKYEVAEGRIYPPSTRTAENICLQNQPPHETRCHDTPEITPNSIVGTNLFTMWFWRNHNRIASTLSDLNPCWSDEKLFSTARDINIATFQQILFYELFPALFGRENLVRDSVISTNLGFRDIYDNKLYPQISTEFPYALRWFHTMQEGRLKMFDVDGSYLKQIPLVNVSLRTGYLAVDNHLDYITQGSFRQASAKIDHIIDPQIGETVFGGMQHVSDVATNDLAKGRYFGFQPYVNYLEFCSGKSINDFDDLADFIDPVNLELLKELYNGHLKDVELLAGIWSEKFVHGGFVPSTVYCIVMRQLLRNVRSDRHWYERPNRPNAFTWQQLQEIRKATVSQLLCDVGDKVTEIQRQGFLRIGPKNKLVSCQEIPRMNLAAWKDNSCKLY